MSWLFLFLYYANAVPISKGPISVPDIISPTWTSCDDMQCISGFVCVLHSSLEYSGPLCVPAGISTCLNVKCTAGFHCIHEEVDCDAAPCHPVPKCVPTDDTGDKYGAPPQEPPLGDAPNDNVDGKGDNGGKQGENGNGNVALTDFCSETNPCFIGFVCDTTGPKPECRKAKSCADTTCESGMTCVSSPRNKDAECSFPGDCTSTGCSATEICVTWNTKVPYCRLPLTCDDIICDVKNNCRPGGPLGDAVCVEQCPATEHWDACGGCDGNCQDGQVACAALCVPSQGACRCNSPLIRGPGGTCIELEACPGKGPLPGIPNPPGSLYSQCQDLNCPSDETCIEQALSVHCGKSDVKCSCNPDQLCVLQVVQCFAPPCNPLPMCVSKGDGYETVETTTEAIPTTTPANPTGTTPDFTTSTGAPTTAAPTTATDEPTTTGASPTDTTTGTSTVTSNYPTPDICALTDCATGLNCVVNADGTASCIPPVTEPPIPTQPPGSANPCENYKCDPGLYCVSTNEGTAQCVIDEPIDLPHPPPLPPPPPPPYPTADPCQCYDCGPALFCVVNGDGKPQCVINKTADGGNPSDPESDGSSPKCILPCAYPLTCTITPIGPKCVQPKAEGVDSASYGAKSPVETPYI